MYILVHAPLSEESSLPDPLSGSHVHFWNNACIEWSVPIMLPGQLYPQTISEYQLPHEK